MKPAESIPLQDRPDDLEDTKEKTPFFATSRGRGISALIMICIVAVVLALQTANSGNIAYEMDSRQLAVSCLKNRPDFIPYEEIISVKMVSSFPMDRIIETSDWDSGWCGIYENEEYGRFSLYAYSNHDQFIVVEYKNGTLIFNVKGRSATQKAYEKLMAHIG